MSPEELARLHAACFVVPRPWTAAEFVAVLATPGAMLVSRPAGLAVGRVAAGEAELLTLAVAPDRRRRGEGRALLGAFEGRARTRGAAAAVLEVAEGNMPARVLYAGAGWSPVGRRPGYYADGQDAVVLRKTLARAGLRSRRTARDP